VSDVARNTAWDLAWRRVVAACAEARRRYAAGGAPAGEADFPAIAPPPTPTPDRPVIRDDLAKLAALSRAYLVTHASAGAAAITVGLLVTSRGPGDLAFGVNVIPEPPGALPPGALGPPIALEASRALLTAPMRRAGRLLPAEGGRLVFEAEPGFEPPSPPRPDGEPGDLPGLIVAAFEAAAGQGRGGPYP
jgi:hypothetical protein